MGDKEKEENLSLPKATVSKLIKEVLPDDIKCSNETRDLILECCVEFIHLISSEANDICNKESKKTITAEHVIKALDDLGFNGYTPKVTETYDRHKEEASAKPSRAARKSENNALSTEEMLLEQQRLFAQARSAYQQQPQQQQDSNNNNTTSTTTDTNIQPPPQ